MSKHIKKFENEAAYNEFKASENYVKPNLSWCKEENTFKAEYRPFNVITVTAEEDSITATAEQTVASTITIVLSGDINNTITIISGQTIGTLSIDTSATVRTCNLSLSPDSDKAYSYVLEASTVTIPSVSHGYSKDYLTIVSASDKNAIGWKASNSKLTRTISISTDNGQTWIDKTSNTSGVRLATLNDGDKLLVKGNNTIYSSGNYCNYFTSTKTFNTEGNIMSLIYGDNFIGQTILPDTNTFYNLFNGSTVVDASNLILPATTLTSNCYNGMFQDCTSLTTAPALPATTLANFCYNSMFRSCTSLTTAPALPATTLAKSCYRYMFYGCTALTTAPILPATTLAQSCYQYMFYGCTALTTAPVLPATTLAQDCYRNMFQGCTSLTTTPVLPATTLVSGCYHTMFQDCTSLTTAPALPATTLADRCYQYMFYNCISLTTAPALPAATLVDDCYQYMFYNCTSLTTVPALPAATLVGYCYQYMFYGCTNLNYIKCLATNIPSNCTSFWTYNVASSGTFVKDPSMNSWTTGVNGIPSNWTVVDA